MITKAIQLLLFISAATALGQSNNLTSSPYSLFGVGSLNEAGSGITNALGKSGMALSGGTFINGLNPAAYAEAAEKSFMFDIGVKGDQNSFANTADDKAHTTTNFSNISFALGISQKSGIGFSLTPYSNVGYLLNGLASSVEGSQETYTTYITGSGGINNVTVNYGYKLTPKLNVGLTGNYFFGKIEQSEDVQLGTDYLSVVTTSYYSGFRAGAGFQYKANDRFTVAGTIAAPTYLKGSQDRAVTKTLNYVAYAEDVTSKEIAGFKLPLETGGGFKYTYKRFTFNADYKHSFWSATGMEDNVGKFTDTDFVGLGLQYVNNKMRPSYFEMLQYRLGLNIDNGYLEVDGARIKNMALTSGIGIPLGSSKSFLNISYSYGQRGAISTKLIKENYHAFTVNLCLEDLWFQKRRYQ